jgi:hypothetical protein
VEWAKRLGGAMGKIDGSLRANNHYATMSNLQGFLLRHAVKASGIRMDSR